MTGYLSTAKKFQLSNSFAAESVEDRKLQSFWLSVGAGLGLAGGFAAGVAGFLLTVMSWLFGNELAASDVGKSATYLILAMIPLIMLGAHCLDKIDDLKRAKRIEFCRRHGLTAGEWQ